MMHPKSSLLRIATYYDRVSTSHSAYQVPANGGGPSNITVLNTTYTVDAPLLNISDRRGADTRCYHEQAFTSAEIVSRTICQPEKFYQWGFSFGLTFFFLITTIWLGLALYIVWLCTFRGRELADAIFGSLKTAMLVSAAMEKAVGGNDTEMSNATLEQERKFKQVVVPLRGKQLQFPADDLKEYERPLTTVSTQDILDMPDPYRKEPTADCAAVSPN